MSSAVAQVNPQKQLSIWLEDEKTAEKIGSLLAGMDMDQKQFCSQVLVSFQDEKIRACTLTSQLECIYLCAQFAFLPSLKHVAIIPRNKKINEQWVKVATFMPQWQGYKALMERSPEVLEVSADIVFDHEQYAWDEDAEVFSHTKDPFDSRRSAKPDLSNICGAYLKVKYRDGRVKYHFVTKAKIHKSMMCSESVRSKITDPHKYKDPTVWEMWTDEQILKTAFRDGFARGVVRVDFAVQAKVNEFVKADDMVLENLPLPSEPAKISSAPPSSRAKAIASQFATPDPVSVPDDANTVETGDSETLEEDVQREEYEPDGLDGVRNILHNCVVPGDVDDVVAKLVDLVDEVTNERMNAAAALCEARKKELAKKGSKK